MTAEGVGIFSISRVKYFSWDTIASWIGKKTTQLSRNLHDNGDNFLVDLYVIGKSDPSKGVYEVYSSITTVN